MSKIITSICVAIRTNIKAIDENLRMFFPFDSFVLSPALEIILMKPTIKPIKHKKYAR